MPLETPPTPAVPPSSSTRGKGFLARSWPLLVLFPALYLGQQLNARRGVRSYDALRATLPTPGTIGVLHKDGQPVPLCLEKPGAIEGHWGGPCNVAEQRDIPEGSRAQIMKVDVFEKRLTACRFWIQGGPDDRYVGDGRCEWFHASP